jgi:hypothetical protein
MEYPRFLVLEASSYQEDAYPVAACWSISDGQLKDVLIRPEQEWINVDASNEDIQTLTRQQLELTGESALDVVRELSEDVDKQQVYVSETYLYRHWLSTLYSAFGAEFSFEIAPLSDLFFMSESELEEELQNLSSNLLLDLRVPEERVRTLLELYSRLRESGALE